MGAVFIVVVIPFEEIGEEEELEDEEEDGEFGKDNGPEISADSHIPESVGIEMPHPAPEPLSRGRGVERRLDAIYMAGIIRFE